MTAYSVTITNFHTNSQVTEPECNYDFACEVIGNLDIDPNDASPVGTSWERDMGDGTYVYIRKVEY